MRGERERESTTVAREGGRVSTIRSSNRAFILSDIVVVSQKGGEPGGGSAALDFDSADPEGAALLIVAVEDH